MLTLIIYYVLVAGGQTIGVFQTPEVCDTFKTLAISEHPERPAASFSCEKRIIVEGTAS